MKTNLNRTTVILNVSEGSKSICHTRPDRVSMDSRIQSENDICGETGRSMVEMLGVLAVIGVLSIGGIAGYTTAMNKHRANDILNAASQRAMVVSAQIQRDANTTPSLAEFSSSNTVNEATFGESVTYTGSSETTFALTLSGLGSDNAICTQMKSIAGTDGNVNVSDDCGTLTYNTDLSASVTTTQNACTTAGKSWCAVLNKCQNTGASCSCPTHQVANEDNDGCVCANGYHESGTECVENDCTGYNEGNCPTDDTCSSCQSGETSYYKITSCGVTGKVPNTNADSCVCDTANNYYDDTDNAGQCVLNRCHNVTCSITGQTCNPDNGQCECSNSQKVYNNTQCVSVSSACGNLSSTSGTNGATGTYVLVNNVVTACQCVANSTLSSGTCSCNNGFKADGKGWCKAATQYTSVLKNPLNLYLGLESNTGCPTGYHWAESTEVTYLGNSITDLFTDTSLCDNCTGKYGLYLKDCEDNDCEGTERAYGIDYEYGVATFSLDNIYGNLLCKKDS